MKQDQKRPTIPRKKFDEILDMLQWRLGSTDDEAARELLALTCFAMCLVHKTYGFPLPAIGEKISDFLSSLDDAQYEELMEIAESFEIIEQLH